MTTQTRMALVTGANRGIGFEIAKSLAHNYGYRVITASRKLEDAEAAADKIGSGSIPARLDLTTSAALQDTAHSLVKQHGHVDVLVNNAGILAAGDGLNLNLADLENSISVNAVSPFVLMQVFGREMKRRDWGRIVNVSSEWGSFEQGLTGPAAYSVSKATMNAITLTFAHSLGKNVKVNAACPGWVRTRMGGMAASRSPEEGADTPVWLATLPDDGPTGGFFSNRRLIGW